MTMRIDPSRLVLVALGLLLVLGGLPAGAPAQELDPATLVGEWTGTWELSNQRGVTGPYYLTVKKVEGGKVHGRVERPGIKVAQPDFDFVGTVSGNVLSFRPQGLARTDLTVTGNEMRGATITSPRLDIQLSKKR